MTKPKTKKPREWWVVVNQNGEGNIEPRITDSCRSDYDSKREALADIVWLKKHWPELDPYKVIKVREVLPKRGK